MRRINIGAKALLVVLLAISMVFGDSDRFHDKAMGARAVAYPLLCAVPFVAWWLLRRRQTRLPYPHAADALVTASFLVDLGGNALDLFDRLEWFDDAAHFLNWFFLGAALGITLRRGRRPWELVWMVTGAGAVMAVVWEYAEYTSFVQTVEQLGIYRDTIGDLCLGTGGALTAGALVAWQQRMAARTRGVDAASERTAG